MSVKTKIDAIIASADQKIAVELTDGRKWNGFAVSDDADSFEFSENSKTDTKTYTIPFSALVNFRPVA